MRTFPQKYQLDAMDCGPTCLCMIADYYGKKCLPSDFQQDCGITREGITMLGLSEAAEAQGLQTLCAKITLDQLAKEIILPCILHWNHNHYVVCYKVSGKENKQKFYIADPAMGNAIYGRKDLYKHWISGKFEGEDVGLAMQLEPNSIFHRKKHIDGNTNFSLYFFLHYILPHKWQILQLLFGTIVIMILGYFSPFISQSIVDIGIMEKDIHFILMMTIVQLTITFSKTSIVFVQSWISLHMNTLINVSLIADYLKKLSHMPLSFFETCTMGDILQRIGDHDRIKNFLMNDSINVVFSIATFITFSVVLGFYNFHILIIFLSGNILHVAWIMLFMKYRRELDNKTFSQSSDLQNNIVQFVQGMQEIKLNCIEQQKCWEWSHLQARLYKLSRRGLKLGQIQSIGSMLFSSITGIAVSYLAAKMVVTGEITFGMMMSMSFILGQVSGPISSFIGFALDYQDAKISLERLSDLHLQNGENEKDDKKVTHIPRAGNLILKNISFSYSGKDWDCVLHDVNLIIPRHKVTAIVGPSGCGKTTLIKMLQRFYVPTCGQILIDDTPLEDIQIKTWRKSIGAVMQDGYIFSDTIANNIMVYSDSPDKEALINAVKRVNLYDFIESLPNKFMTKIGSEGMGLSQGQKQRILLARAIYKNPEFIFLDEATNALDAKNESMIVNNLEALFVGKTVVIAAHRLSTIKNADNIIVLNEGKIIEQGSHEKLIASHGFYYALIRAQLNNIE